MGVRKALSPVCVCCDCSIGAALACVCDGRLRETYTGKPPNSARTIKETPGSLWSRAGAADWAHARRGGVAKVCQSPVAAYTSTERCGAGSPVRRYRGAARRQVKSSRDLATCRFRWKLVDSPPSIVDFITRVVDFGGPPDCRFPTGTCWFPHVLSEVGATKIICAVLSHTILISHMWQTLLQACSCVRQNAKTFTPSVDH